MAVVVNVFVLTSIACMMNGCSSQKATPRVSCLEARGLEQSRQAIQRGDPRFLAAVAALRVQADQALQVRPVSVMDKSVVPPSGDKHDFRSLGPYWWPDPAKQDGLPYIRRDGEINPESRGPGSDRPALETMSASVTTLALAWYFTGHEPYARHAATMLRVWFLNPDTRMNPHLKYGQGIPGIVDGRGIGIIDTHALPQVMDAVGLLASYPAWTTQDQAGMKAWAAAYLDWLLTSDLGRSEAKEHNNHGTWYDVQVSSLALFAGRADVARTVIEAARERRLARHVRPDGSQPAELARTRSLDYSIFNLRAMMLLAEMGETVGVELWNYQTSEGAGLRQAIEYVAPYVDPARKWPHQQIIQAPFVGRDLPLILRRAALAYHDPRFLDYAHQLPPDRDSSPVATLIYPAELDSRLYKEK
jgi:hypothetical protein